jgi:hypothetical protein
MAVDAATLGFGPRGAAPIRIRVRDVNGDDWDDLVLSFRLRETGIVRSDAEVCLSGTTFEGLEFEGCTRSIGGPEAEPSALHGVTAPGR